MNIRDLKYLIALDEHRHFGNAARASFVSQPTLSMQIKKLEETLGVQLLERNSKHVLFTKTGERILLHCRRIMNEVDTITKIAKTSQDPFAGEIKLGIIPTLAPYLLPHTIPSLNKKFPRLTLLLIEKQTAVLTEQLRLGDIDCMILALPIEGEDFATIELFDEPFLFAMQRDHLLANRKRIRQEDLQGQNILLLEEGHCLRDQALDICNANNANISNFRATSLETLRQMVAAGVGVTLIPKLASHIAPASIRYVSFNKPVPVRKIGLLWRKTAANTELYETMADIIKEKIAALL